MKSAVTPAARVFFPNLDGLRFFAFLVVFLSHCMIFSGYHNYTKAYTVMKHFFGNGNLGVCFFFVLSGFLITYLLFKELETGKKIKLGYFYVRRILRIWPVYILVIALGFFILPHIHFITGKHALLNFPLAAELQRLPWYAFFAANFDLIANGAISVIVVSLWSLSVEEQFYFLWPLLLSFIKTKKTDKVFYGLIVLSFIYRCFYSGSPDVLAFSTLSVINYLCVGALAAYYALYLPSFKHKFVSLKRKQIVLVYFFGLCMFPLRGFSHIFGETFFHLYIPFEALLFSAFFAFIILEQNFSEHSFFKAGRWRLLSYLGRISYGLYCYHMLAMVLVICLFIHFELALSNGFYFILLIFLSLLLTVLISVISYLVLEKRIINFKEKFSLVKNREG